MVISVERPVRILLVAEHTIVRAGYRMLIESLSKMQVIAEAAGGNEAVDLAGSEAPDGIVLVLNLEVNGPMTGRGVIHTLVRARTGARGLALPDRIGHQIAAEFA